MRLKWVLWVLIVLMGTAFAAADDEEVSIYTVLPAEPAQSAVPAPEASPEPTEAVAQEATAAPEADPRRAGGVHRPHARPGPNPG